MFLNYRRETIDWIEEEKYYSLLQQYHNDYNNLISIPDEIEGGEIFISDLVIFMTWTVNTYIQKYDYQWHFLHLADIIVS